MALAPTTTPTDFSNINIDAALTAPPNPAAFVRGLTDVSSGSGHWTLTPPPNSTIAVADPGMEGAFPHIQLLVDMTSLSPSTMGFLGPVAPTPPDAIGFTAMFDFGFINDTGTTLQGVLLSLANADPKTPLNLVPGKIAFGHDVNANYAFFTDLVPNAFTPETVGLFSPDGQPTTTTGPAASTIALSGPIAPGALIMGSVAVHNTELMTGNNNFGLTITPV